MLPMNWTTTSDEGTSCIIVPDHDPRRASDELVDHPDHPPQRRGRQLS
jgi:hypothetical protein